jgi:SAM-dependent methyltransferase
MTIPFGSGYASSYDAIYADKDYRTETDVLESAFSWASRAISSILDLGCGTGLHAAELAMRGYEVVGVDRSAAMLQRARQRMEVQSLPQLSFVEGDIRYVDLGRRFDCVISMFAVIGYLLTDADIASSFANVRRHLEPGGLFIFDVWYGPAVEAIGPSDRRKVMPSESGEIERLARGRLDPETHTCTIDYEVSEPGYDGERRTTAETHQVRYYTREELAAFLGEADLHLIDLRAFPDVAATPSLESWNVIAFALG